MTDAKKQTDLKVAVLNYAGGVGKTTVVANLIKPRFNDTPVIAIETINDGGQTEFKIKGNEFGRLQDELLLSDKLIVDIGASNIEETMRMMEQYSGSHEDFDYFILPVTPDGKEQVDTAAAITALMKMGVPSSKIRLIFNKVTDLEKLNDDFEVIIDFAKKVKIKIPVTGIATNDVYDDLRHRNMSIEDLLSMKDLREKMRAAKEKSKKREVASLIGLQRLAITASKNLDDVFDNLDLK